MIKVSNVSMRFNLGIEKNSSLKQKFINLLSFNFKKENKKEFYAIKDLSFELQKGDVLGIIGNNGAGKSTLLKLIAGVMKPTKGMVEVNGRISPMIELGAGFDSELTARENIYLNGAILGHSKQLLDSKFNEIVDFSELKEFLDVPVKNFSSGMVARLAFSISTIIEPGILIVDEILGTGDANFQIKSSEKMKNMIKEGTTVLLVSHSIDSIKNMCNKVMWLENGKLKKIGGPEVCDEYMKANDISKD